MKTWMWIFLLSIGIGIGGLCLKPAIPITEPPIQPTKAGQDIWVKPYQKELCDSDSATKAWFSLPRH